MLAGRAICAVTAFSSIQSCAISEFQAQIPKAMMTTIRLARNPRACFIILICPPLIAEAANTSIYRTGNHDAEHLQNAYFRYIAFLSLCFAG